MNVSEHALLVTLRIGAWSGFSQETKNGKQYRKRLIAPKFFHEIGSAISGIRRLHRTLTLPWDGDSTRIISNQGYSSYTKKMRLAEGAFNKAVTDLGRALPLAIKEAKDRLGAEFNKGDYPSADELATKFWFELEKNKVPEATDFKVQELAEAVLIAKEIDRLTTKRIKLAEMDLWERVFVATTYMAKKLRGFKPATAGKPATDIFRDSLIINMSHLAVSLVSLNIRHLSSMQAVQFRIVEDLLEYQPEALRTNPKARAEIAAKAESIAKTAKFHMK